jgi:hypothetical protein
MTKLRSVVVVALFGTQVGCAGAGGSPAASAPPGAGPVPSGGDAAAGTEAPAAAPPTTTTTSLADGGAQGTKLAEIHPAASAAPATSAASPAPKGAHTHDAGRGPDDIRAIVIAHRDEARACYDRALSDHPGIEGDLVVQWTIDPKGAVTQISLDSGRSKVTEPSVVGCITGIIQKIQFAPSPGGFETKASYPFNFHPRHAKP